MTSTHEIAGYIVYQSGYAIFGTGASPEAAEANAAEWTGGEAIDADEGGRGEVHGAWYYLPATARLIAAVAERGGDIGWAVVGGVADLAD